MYADKENKRLTVCQGSDVLFNRNALRSGLPSKSIMIGLKKNRIMHYKPQRGGRTTKQTFEVFRGKVSNYLLLPLLCNKLYRTRPSRVSSVVILSSVEKKIHIRYTHYMCKNRLHQ